MKLHIYVQYVTYVTGLYTITEDLHTEALEKTLHEPSLADNHTWTQSAHWSPSPHGVSVVLLQLRKLHSLYTLCFPVFSFYVFLY